MPNLRLRSTFRSIALACTVAVTSLAQTPRASACTCQSQILDGEPANGAVDVPTDVIPWVTGSNCGLAGRLLDPNGAEVPIELHALHGDGTTHHTTVESSRASRSRRRRTSFSK